MKLFLEVHSQWALVFLKLETKALVAMLVLSLEESSNCNPFQAGAVGHGNGWLLFVYNFILYGGGPFDLRFFEEK